jgi:HKD family nuclease
VLDPKQNRVDYGSQLAPPDGYELSTAIGTTYSLDLEALMLIPVSLFYSQPIEGDPDQIRYDMLDAITNASKKITLFCQKGQIKVPKKYHPMMAYWENGIVQVQMEKDNQSFHPKVWIIRYEKEANKAIYKLLVTSRNLTFDQSWDMAFSTMGIVGDETVEENQPLIDFVKYLYSNTKKRIDRNFLSELAKVRFKMPDGVQGLSFHPIGIKGGSKSEAKAKSPLLFESWNQLLIVSPFLDKKTLEHFKDKTQKPVAVFSSKDALDGIEKSVLSDKLDLWKFSTVLENAMHLSEVDETLIEGVEQGLHAKLFVGVKEGKSHWFIGSANCTDPAMERNIEFLVRLISKGKDRFKPFSLKKQLTGQIGDEKGIKMFEPYDLEEERDSTSTLNQDQIIRKLKYQISKSKLYGKVVASEQGSSFDFLLVFDARRVKLQKDFSITLKPLVENSKKPYLVKAGEINEIHSFGPYSEAELSPYIVFSIYHEDLRLSTFLLEMEVELPESRLGRIFSLIIDNRDKFLKYLTFLLTGEETSVILDSNTKNASTGKNGLAGFLDGTPLFEKMMLASSRSPSKLKAVDELVKRLKSEDKESKPIIDEDFEEFWSILKEFVPKR